MAKYWYAVTTPYSGMWVNSEGRWLGEQLRFDTKTERDAFVAEDDEGKIKAIRARQVQRRQGQWWVDSNQPYTLSDPNHKFQILVTV